MKDTVTRNTTIEGLIKVMNDNNDTAMGIFDEMTFVDNLDRGTTGGCDRGTFMTLYNATEWIKSTKTYGKTTINDTRFNIIGYIDGTRGKC